jgi:hypothetical protein
MAWRIRQRKGRPVAICLALTVVTAWLAPVQAGGILKHRAGARSVATAPAYYAQAPAYVPTSAPMYTYAPASTPGYYAPTSYSVQGMHPGPQSPAASAPIYYYMPSGQPTPLFAPAATASATSAAAPSGSPLPQALVLTDAARATFLDDLRRFYAANNNSDSGLGRIGDLMGEARTRYLDYREAVAGPDATPSDQLSAAEQDQLSRLVDRVVEDDRLRVVRDSIGAADDRNGGHAPALQYMPSATYYYIQQPAGGPSSQPPIHHR